MHTQKPKKKERTTQEEQLFFYRVFLRRGFLVLQLLQTTQGFTFDKATQLRMLVSREVLSPAWG